MTAKPHPRYVAAYAERPITIAPDAVLPPAVREVAAVAREAVALAREADRALGGAKDAAKAAQEAYSAAVTEAAGAGEAMPATEALEAAAATLEDASRRAEGAHRHRGERLAEYVAELKAHRDEHLAGIPGRVAEHRARVAELLAELEAEVDLIGYETGLARWYDLVGRTPALSSWKPLSGLDMPPNLPPVTTYAAQLVAALERSIAKAVPGPPKPPATGVRPEHLSRLEVDDDRRFDHLR